MSFESRSGPVPLDPGPSFIRRVRISEFATASSTTHSCEFIERRIPESVTSALEIWAQSRDERAETIVDPRISSTELLRELVRPISCEGSRFWMRRDIEELIAVLLTRLGDQRLRVQLGPVRTDQCRKFHVDFLTERLLCTYVGPGTEWIPDDAVDWSAIENPPQCPREANQAICRDPSQIRRALGGDVLILRGRHFAGSRGVVHRSPPIEEAGLKRVVLTISGVV